MTSPVLQSRTDALAACEARYTPLLATAASNVARATASQKSLKDAHDADVAQLNAYYDAQAKFADIQAILSVVPQDAVIPGAINPQPL